MDSNKIIENMNITLSYDKDIINKLEKDIVEINECIKDIQFDGTNIISVEHKINAIESNIDRLTDETEKISSNLARIKTNLVSYNVTTGNIVVTWNMINDKNKSIIQRIKQAKAGINNLKQNIYNNINNKSNRNSKTNKKLNTYCVQYQNKWYSIEAEGPSKAVDKLVAQLNIKGQVKRIFNKDWKVEYGTSPNRIYVTTPENKKSYAYSGRHSAVYNYLIL